MQRLTLVIGGILVVLGVVAYVATGAASVTALIPAFVGLLLVICGVIAGRGEKARMHATHAALLIALLGAIGALMRVITVAALTPAVIVSAIMFVLLVVYLVMGIRSFIAARRARTNA
jgi:hypothetical protein